MASKNISKALRIPAREPKATRAFAFFCSVFLLSNASAYADPMPISNIFDAFNMQPNGDFTPICHGANCQTDITYVGSPAAPNWGSNTAFGAIYTNINTATFAATGDEAREPKNEGDGATFILTDHYDMADSSVYHVTGGEIYLTPQPMTINSISDLQNIQNFPSGKYVLGSDINATGFNYSAFDFSGSLDGQGHTISNLTVVSSQSGGLFSTNTGSIENLNLQNISITAGSVSNAASPDYQPGNIGAIADSNAGIISNITISGTSLIGVVGSKVGGVVASNTGLIENTSVQGAFSTSGSNDYGGITGGVAAYNLGIVRDTSTTVSITAAGNVLAGGIVGLNDGSIFSHGTIDHSTAAGEITGGDTGQTGGLAGLSAGSISASTSSITVVGGSNAYVGGLVGLNGGPIEQSSATGNVTAGVQSLIGGLVGFQGIPQLGSRIDQSFATGNVAGGAGSTLGGLVGWNLDTPITTSYALGAVTGNGSNAIGGLVGRNGACQPCLASIDQSYSAGRVSDPNAQTIGGLVGLNEDAFRSASVSNAAWDIQRSGQLSGAGSGTTFDASGLTTAELKSGNLPNGFDPTVWRTTPGQYPTLQWQAAVAPPPSLLSAPIAVALSNLAYLSASVIMSGHLPVGYSMPPGYSVAMLNGMPLEFGKTDYFHAVVFQGPSNIGLVISFQGSNGFPNNLITSPSNWADLGFLGCASDCTLNSFYQFAQTALNIAEGIAELNGGESIHLTGHSLGGGIAQILGSVAGIDTVTFNAPGTQVFMQSRGLVPSGDNSNIKNYRMAGDIISLLPGKDTQVGEVITLPSQKPNSLDPLSWQFNHDIKTIIGAINQTPSSDFKPGISGQTDTSSLYVQIGDIDVTVLDGVTFVSLKAGVETFDFAVQGSVQYLLGYSPDPIGFNFAVGAGDPNFASVTLPVQSGPYDIEALIGGMWQAEGLLLSLDTFVFPDGGVSDFRVLDVDRLNLPFIADVTFAGDGQFTGTISPIQAPEPSSLTLFGSGLLIFVFS